MTCAVLERRTDRAKSMPQAERGCYYKQINNNVATELFNEQRF
jgi:hypothetical protein